MYQDNLFQLTINNGATSTHINIPWQLQRFRARPVLFCRGKMPRARGMAAYVRDGYGAFRQPKFECGCCEMLDFRVCSVRQTFMCTVFIATLTQMTIFFIVYQHQQKGSQRVELPLGGSECIISVGDYVDNLFTALGSSKLREVRLELQLVFYVFHFQFVQVHFVFC